MNSIQLYKALQAHVQKMGEINTKLYHAGMDTAEAMAEVKEEITRFQSKIETDVTPATPAQS